MNKHRRGEPRHEAVIPLSLEGAMMECFAEPQLTAVAICLLAKMLRELMNSRTIRKAAAVSP